MEQPMYSYATAYGACLLFAAAAVLIRFAPGMKDGGRLLSGSLLIPLMIVYLAGMHRTAGIDYDNYSEAYRGIQDIPDLGYVGLTAATKWAGLSFDNFVLLIGILTLVVMWHVAPRLGSDPIVAIAIYMMHLAIGRDLSQIRIGLAVVIFLLATIQKRMIWQVVFCILAASLHITVIVLVGIWYYSGRTFGMSPKRRLFFVYLPVIGFAALGSVLLSLAAFIDPRVEIYLSWNDDSFGAPLASFAALGRTAVVVLVYLAAIHRFKDIRYKRYIDMELAGAAILLGLSAFSIFSARLSNVAISMYPIGLGIVAMACRRDSNSRLSTLGSALVLKAALVATMGILIARPASYEALGEVIPSVFRDLEKLD